MTPSSLTLATLLAFGNAGEAALEPPPPPGDRARAPDPDDAIVRSSRHTRIDVDQVGGGRVVMGTVSLAWVDERGGEDVVVKVWNLPPGTAVWAVVERGDGTWSAFGPGREEGRGDVRITGVVLGPGLTGGRRVRLRVVASSALPPAGVPVSPDFLAQAVAQSILVEARIASRSTDIGGACEIHLQTAAEATLVEGPLVLPPKTSLGGSFACGAADATGRRTVQGAYRCGTETAWRLLGPAHTDPRRQRFRLDGATLAPSAPRQGYRCDLQMLVSSQPLDPAATRLDWERYIEGASVTREVIVEPAGPAALRPLDRLVLRGLTLAGGVVARVQGARPMEVDTAEHVLTAFGSIETPRDGQDLFVLVSAVGSGIWWTVGRALIDGHEWVLPIDGLPWTSAGAERAFQIVAVQSGALLVGAALSYDQWAGVVTGKSNIALMEVTAAARHRALQPSLALRQVGADAYDDAMPLALTPGMKLAGVAGGLPAGRRYYVTAAVERADRTGWSLGGSAPVMDGKWWLTLPDLAAAGVAPVRGLNLVLTPVPLRPDTLTTAQLWSLAMVATPPIHLVTAETAPRGWSLSGGTMLMLALALLTLLAVIGAWRRVGRAGAAVATPASPDAAPKSAGAVGRLVGRVDAGLRHKLPWLDTPTHDHWSVLAIGLGVLVGVIINLYAPVYVEAFLQVYPASEAAATRICYMLIAFTGTTGILVHMAARSQKAGMMLFKFVLLVLTPVAWLFAAFTYYSAHRQDGNDMAAAVLGAAVLLGNVTETLASYMAMRYGGELAVWIVVQLLRAPLVLLGAPPPDAGEPKMGTPHMPPTPSPARVAPPVAWVPATAAAHPAVSEARELAPRKEPS